MSRKRVDEVFGISHTVLADSYVDRGKLDQELARYFGRPVHIALRGESKCGKSWLRQHQIQTALTVQCRLGKTAEDLYVDALSQLEIRLDIGRSVTGGFTGTISAKGKLGLKLLAEVGLDVSLEGSRSVDTSTEAAGHDISDLRYIADVIKTSGQRLVIEDFHYMSTSERKKFAFDLKALWEYSLFVVVIGVWSQSNMLIYLNPDLSGRVHEIPIYWSREDLIAVLEKGGEALNLDFSAKFKDTAARDCFGSVGILQKITQMTLDELHLEYAQASVLLVDHPDSLESASMQYAEQLNPLYQQFARRVSNGIRQRKNSTGIYAHAMAVILEADDSRLIGGLSIDWIFDEAHRREARIQKGNLRTVRENFEALQIDDDGRGLVVAYNEATGDVSVVDRQLLLYRKYSTIKWP